MKYSMKSTRNTCEERAFLFWRKRWEDNVREWTGLEFAKSQRAVENRKKIEKTGRKIICGSPTTLAVKGLMMMMNSLKTQSPAYRISLGR